MTRAFLDTNILIYAYSLNDPRMESAQKLIGEGSAISVQCLNEFANVALRKLNMSWPELREAIDLICALCAPVVPLDASLQAMGLGLAEKYQLGIYDGMIVAAARIAGCDTLYTEDLHHGLVVDGQLRVTNPFRE